MKALLPLLCLAFAAHAADRVALVIGNDAYKHARKLNTAVNDATAVAAKLRQLQFDVITLPNAGVEQMLTALESLKGKAADARAVLVYYAGHGIESDGVNYLVPVDARLEREIQLKTQAVSLDNVLDELKRINVPARMVILDCCRDNPLEGRSWLATRSAGGGGLGALAQDTLSEATLVVYSASPGKPALDRVEQADAHSPFTSALLAEMPKPGVHSFEMFGRVEDTVIQKTSGRQAPRIFYNGSTQPFRSFIFTPETAGPITAADTPPAPAAQPMPQPPNIVSSPPSTAPQPAIPTLPASGYFDLDALYLSGPYAAYNRYSRIHILKQAQTKLKAAGFYTSTADGEPGPGTQRAILAYQQAQNLPLSGKLDAATLASLSLSGQSQMSAPVASKPTPNRKPTKPRYAAPTTPPPAPVPRYTTESDILFGR